MFSRRQFLERSSLLALAPTLPAFLAQSVRAAAKPSRDDTILVVLQLDGGNDGLNTVIPHADEGYATNRRKLKLPVDRLIKLNDQVALHPSMRAAADLIDDGRLAIVQAVGYPNPSRSHFRSMAIWHTARFKEDEHNSYGWAGRALDSAKRRRGADAIFVGSEKLPLALRGRRCLASAMLHGEDLALATPVKPQTVLKQQAGRQGDAGEDLSSFVQRSVLDAYTTSDELSKATRQAKSDVSYPQTQLAGRLRLIAQLIKSGLPTRVYYASQSGYDTHAVQLPTHARLLREFAEGTKALLDDLASADLAQRVVVMAFSEFGRRAKENGSLGTDHGTAGPVFIAGSSVKAGLVGNPPNLGDLQDGDIKTQFDFRQVYATVLERWLSLDPQPALSGDFRELPLFA